MSDNNANQSSNQPNRFDPTYDAQGTQRELRIEKNPDGVRLSMATDVDLATFDKANEQLQGFKVPQLYNNNSVSDANSRPPLFTLLLHILRKPHEYWAVAWQSLLRLIPHAQTALLLVKILRTLTGVFASTLILGACAMNTANIATRTTVDNISNNPQRTATSKLDYSKPFTFNEHNFGADFFDASDIDIIYDKFNHGPSKRGVLYPSKKTGDEKYWSGTYGSVRNFPPPAQVKWKAKDGTPLEATVDIGKIFDKQVVLHNENPANLSRAFIPTTSVDIILEINNRTINVYMKVGLIYLKAPKNEETRELKYALTLAYSKTY